MRRRKTTVLRNFTPSQIVYFEWNSGFMGKSRFGSQFNVFFVIYAFLAHRFMPKHDGQIQLLTYQIKMLRDRISDPRILPTPEERKERLRLEAVISFGY